MWRLHTFAVVQCSVSRLYIASSSLIFSRVVESSESSRPLGGRPADRAIVFLLQVGPAASPIEQTQTQTHRRHQLSARGPLPRAFCPARRPAAAEGRGYTTKKKKSKSNKLYLLSAAAAVRHVVAFWPDFAVYCYYVQWNSHSFLSSIKLYYSIQIYIVNVLFETQTAHLLKIKKVNKLPINPQRLFSLS